MKKKKQNQDDFKLVCGTILSSVLSFFIVLLLAFFSLRYDDYYFNILETKVKFYKYCAVAMISLAAFLTLIFMFIDFTEFKGKHTKQKMKKLLPSNWTTTFTLADAVLLLYLFVNIVSTLFSDYPEAAFWGSNGRHTGLYLNLLYVTTYFLISRFWHAKSYYFEIFLISGMLVCLLGITDYFQLDLLHFRDRISAGQATIYMSTIGNINSYTAYIALVMGFSAAMYLTTASSRKQIWYFVCMIISFFAIIMGMSESAYLSIGVLFAFTPLFVFHNGKGLIRYLIMLASFLTVILCTDWLSSAFWQHAIGLDDLFQLITGGKKLLILVILLYAIIGGLIIAGKRFTKLWIFSKKLPITIWSGFLLFCFVILIFALYDVNVLGNEQRYGALNSYLLFNDSWGTNRGYIWRKAFETFSDFSFGRKLFGFGPETFRFISDSFYNEMIAATGQHFDNVHNEYLQYLVTIGLLGLGSYLLYLGSLITIFIKKLKENPYIIGILWAILCYLFQAIVNINVPIVTPLLWLLMSCGMALCRDSQQV